MKINVVFQCILAIVVLSVHTHAQSAWERVPGPPGGSIYDVAIEGDTILVSIRASFSSPDNGGF